MIARKTAADAACENGTFAVTPATSSAAAAALRRRGAELDDGLCDGSKTVADVCIGGEDRNDNGRRDPSETDPNDEDDDVNATDGCACNAASPASTTGLSPLLALCLVAAYLRRRR